MRRLILRCFQSPGAVVMLTAAVRNLHQTHPHQFLIYVRTSSDGNQHPGHFLHGFFQFRKQRLVLTPAGVLCGDIQLSHAERARSRLVTLTCQTNWRRAEPRVRSWAATLSKPMAGLSGAQQRLRGSRPPRCWNWLLPNADVAKRTVMLTHYVGAKYESNRM